MLAETALRIQTPSLAQVITTGFLAIAFGLFFGATSSYHIRSFDKVFSAYIHNRTPENEALLNAEREKLQHTRNVGSIKAALLFFFISNFVYSSLRRRFRLAALSLLAACTAFLAYVGLPSIPIDWGCCAYWGPGFDNGVSKAAVQVSAVSVWVVSATLFVLSLFFRRRTQTPAHASEE